MNLLHWIRRRRCRPPSATARYRFIAPLGEGGIARVARTFDVSLNRIVALKTLKERSCESSDVLSAFAREARLISYLDHPGVVPLYDFHHESGESPCYAMKLIEGESLARRIHYDAQRRRADPLPFPEALELCAKIAETMLYAHDRGVVHLDLKPDNIMVGRYGEVLIMDWGNARLYDREPYLEYLHGHRGEADPSPLLAEPGDLFAGTPLFMSPEQCERSRNELRPASDVFSAGIILYLLLSGELPFKGRGPGEVLAQIRELEPPAPHELNPEVPRRFSEICTRMLAKNPDERYRDFRALQRDLTALRDAGQIFALRAVRRGEVIFEEGDRGECAYLILSGRVEVSKRASGKSRVLAELGRNEILGELAILTGEARSATATALEATTLRLMSRADVEKELTKLAPWVGSMITTLARRFLDLNQRLVDTPPDPHD